MPFLYLGDWSPRRIVAVLRPVRSWSATTGEEELSANVGIRRNYRGHAEDALHECPAVLAWGRWHSPTPSANQFATLHVNLHIPRITGRHAHESAATR